MTLDELRNLDLRDVNFADVGDWPIAGRLFIMALVVLFVLAVGYFLVVRGKLQDLSNARTTETQLRHQFSSKQHLAANLDAYEAQLAQMREDLGALLRQLPGQNEIDALLRDISQTAQEDGLSQKLFQPQAEQSKGFYAEKPIRMSYVGSYQQIAKFVSDVSSLPRIVTLRNFSLHPVKHSDGSELNFAVTGVTYRYLSAKEMSRHHKKGRR